ncbi:MAG: tetratricopeptide repeat protein [bacterium]
MRKQIFFLILLLMLISLFQVPSLLATGAIGYLQRANEYLKEKKYSLAINEYKTALKINPYYKEAYYQLALAYFGKNNLTKAEENFKEAIKLDQYYFDAHNDLGLLYEEQGKLEEALKKYDQAKEIAPGNPKVYYNLGSLYHKKNDLKKAIVNYIKVLKIDPRHVLSYLNLGSLFLIEGKYYDPDKAMAYYQKALLCDPANSLININIASIYYKQGLIDKAIKEYQKAIEKSPQDVYSLAALAAIYMEKQNYNLALFLYKKIAEIEPENFISWYNLGFIYEVEKKYPQALDYYKIALQVNPYDELALYHLENIILKNEDISSPLRSEYAQRHLNLGQYYLKKQQVALAKYEFKRSIKLYPQNPVNRFAYCKLLKYKGCFPEAIEEIKKVIELDPNNIKAKDNLEKLFYLRSRLLSEKEKIDLLLTPSSGTTILIISFKPKKIFHQDIDHYLTYLATTLLKEFPQIEILDRDKLNEFLKNQKFKEVKDIEDISKVGQALKAQVVLWGEATEEIDEIKVSINLVDVENLTSISRIDLTNKGNNRLLEMANQIQGYILKNTPLSGNIIKVKLAKNQVIINLGNRHKVKENDVFEVWEEGGKYLDPGTGRTKRFKERIIGKIKVAKAENNISLATSITFELIDKLKANKVTLIR